ncbi:MAG: hypothetical protein H7318_12485 [Oligoflexus sp.]|nr:hypothetical protein [Oligoflexus sp.]
MTLSFFASALSIGSDALAVDVLGQFRLGSYTRSVEFEQSLNGETSNDEKVFSAQLKMEIYDFSSSEDTIVMDLRDKVDNYGKLETSNLTLDTYNRMQIRELAYKRPFETNKLYFSLGRFSLPEANVIDNDGAEFGYHFSKSLRFSVFGGIAPKDVVTPYYVDPDATSDVNNAQGGVYLSYEKKNGLERSLYTNNAIAMGPTYNITDKKSHSYFYHMALWNLNPSNRISSFVQQDFVPTSSLRRASLSHSYFDPKFRTNLSLSQTNTEDYLIQQDILDPLPPSAEQSLRFDLRHRMLNWISMDYSGGYSKREVDGKSQSEIAIGFVLPKLLLPTGSFRAQYGVRDNYFSKDRFIRGGYDYWNQSFSLSLIHTSSAEEFDDKTKNNRQTTNIDGGFFLSDRLRGSLGYQIEQDDKVSASALFVMIGYRFGSSSVPPIRNKPALFEEI